MALQKAKRTASKLRIAFTGPTNGGKTYSSLRLAYGIVKGSNPNLSDDEIWEKIAVGDTERRRAQFYAERTDLPLQTGSFLYQSIEAPYHPQKAIDFIKTAQEAVGEDGVIILDSISHFWSYSGGVLDLKEEIAKQAGKTSYTAWNEAGQIQNEWLDVLLSAKCHVIVTMRSKMDYVLEQNEYGKHVPKKVGLAPIQRDDTEYEFDITLMLDQNHNATIIKDTTFLNQIGFEGLVTEDLGMQLVSWMNEGLDPKIFIEEERMLIINEIKELGKQFPALITMYKTLHPNKKTDELDIKEAKEVLKQFKEALQ